MKWMCAACLVISSTAVFIALRAQSNAQQAAVEVVQEREQELIDSLWPQLREVYADIGEPEATPSERPRSIEELFEPLFRTIELR